MIFGLVIIAAVLSLVACQPVIDFKPYNQTAATMFQIEDLDKDGNLTRAEVDGSFVKYDFNKDGRVERLEYTCYQYHVHPGLGSFANALFDEYDTDNDHHLNVHDMDRLYNKMDTNGDQGVDISEYIAFWVSLFTKYENYHIHGQHHPQHEPKACEHIHGGIIG